MSNWSDEEENKFFHDGADASANTVPSFQEIQVNEESLQSSGKKSNLTLPAKSNPNFRPLPTSASSPNLKGDSSFAFRTLRNLVKHSSSRTHERDVDDSQQIHPHPVRRFFSLRQFSRSNKDHTPYTMGRIGLLEQLAEDNVLSMRWYMANDKSPRHKSIFGFASSLLLTSLIILAYFGLFTFFPSENALSFDRDNIELFIEFVGRFGFLTSLFSSSGFLLLIYMLDLHNGSSFQRRTAMGLFLVGGIGLFTSLSFYFRDVVIVPLIIFCVSMPIMLTLVKLIFFPNMDSLLYMLGIIFPLWAGVGISLIIIGVLYSFSPWSNLAVQTVYSRKAGCDLDLFEVQVATELGLIHDAQYFDSENEFEVRGDLLRLDNSHGRAFNMRIGELMIKSSIRNDDFCYSRAQTLYHGPSLFIVVSTFFIWFMWELIKVSYKDREIRRFSNISKSFQVLLLSLSVIAFAAWIALTILQDELNFNSPVSFSTLLLIFVGVMVGIGAYITYNVLGVAYLAVQLNRTPIGKRVYEISGSEFVHAALVYFLLPLYFIWVIASIPTQFIRKYTILGKRIPKESEEERRLWVKKECLDVYRKVESWDLGKMLHKSMIIGIAYFVLAVFIGRFTTVILAFFRDILIKISLAVATIAFFILGLLLFSAPMMPALPIYLAGGVILFSNAQQTFSTTYAMIYAIGWTYILRLVAFGVQQKVIGEWIGSRSVAVRSQCGVNSPSLKSIRHILQSNENFVGRIAILCGGPGWPTAVLTGILKLNVVTTVLGITPLIVLVACCTAAGAFLVFDIGTSDEAAGVNCTDLTESDISPSSLTLCEEEASVITSIRAVLLSGTVIIQSLLTILAFHEISWFVDNKPEIIAMIPDDLEVVEYDATNLRKYAIREDQLAWKNLSFSLKLLHIVAVILFISTNWAFQFASSIFFNSIEPTDKAEIPFTEPGWILFGVFLIPCFYFAWFQRHIGRRVNHIIEQQDLLARNPEQEPVGV